MAVPAAIVTSFIVILIVSPSPLVNKGLVNEFSDSVIPTPSTTSTTLESTADLVKSTEVSSIKENKEKVEESKAQSETMTETVGASEKPQSESATTASIDATFTQIMEQLLRLLLRLLEMVQLLSQMATLQEKSVLMQQHRWQQ